MLGTVETLTFDAATVALVLGIGTRFLVAFSTKINDATVRSIVAGVVLVLGAVGAYATNAVGDIALWPDLAIVIAIASALVIGVDRTVIGQLFKWVDEHFPGFWKVDPNSVGIGRSPATILAKTPASQKSHPPEGDTAVVPESDGTLPSPEAVEQFKPEA